MGVRESSLMYYALNIGAEILGLAICYNSLQSPDILTTLRYGLYVSVVIDILRGIVSLLAIIFAFIWGSTGLSADAKKTVTVVIWVLTGLGLGIGFGLCIFYEASFKSTDMAATPWLSTYYYFGVVFYALMKSILFAAGGYYLVNYVESLTTLGAYRKVPTNEGVEMRPLYQRVPVYSSQ